MSPIASGSRDTKKVPDMDERMLLSGPGGCLFLAINFSLRITHLSVSGNRLAASILAL